MSILIRGVEMPKEEELLCMESKIEKLTEEVNHERVDQRKG